MSTEPAGWLEAEEACEILGVKRPTLYAYASRGKIRTTPAPDGRRRRYFRDDLLRLAARSGARAGHAAVASGALRWGEPVLDSAITEITPRGPSYRGTLAVDLLDQSFEDVADHLWQAKGPWGRPRHGQRATVGEGPLDPIVAVIVSAAASEAPHIDRAAALDAARRLIPAVAARSRAFESAVPADALEAPTVAEAFLRSWEVRPTEKRLRLVNMALVLVADHELNPSSFAARVAASTGAPLYLCLLAAVATLSGPKHGAAPAQIGALLGEIRRADQAFDVLRDRLRRGDAMPGFGHPLYPDGDPRFPPLYELAKQMGAEKNMLSLRNLVFAMEIAGGPPPTVDLALVAAARAMGLEANAASALFAVGRMAGWVAHALEQQEAGFILRPRARYVG